MDAELIQTAVAPHHPARATRLAIAARARRRWVPAVLAGLCLAGSASAVGLGPARGQVLVGRPLQVTLPILLDAPGDTVPDCVSADVLYGDVHVAARAISAQVQDGRAVRVLAQSPVDEPVVTVDVHLGCADRITRRAVLLADPVDPRADERVAALAAVAPAALPRVAPPAAAAAPARSASARVASAPATSPRQGRGAAMPGTDTVATAATRRVQHAPRRQAPAAPAARLQLAPLDLSALGEPTLRLSDSLASPAEATPERRAEAMAAWRALTAQPDELLAQDRRIADLQRQQQAAAQRQQAQLDGLDRRLAESEARRYANPLLAALALAALLAVVVALVLWRRLARVQRDATPWWTGADDEQSPASGLADLGATPTTAPVQPVWTPSPPPVTAPVPPLAAVAVPARTPPMPPPAPAPLPDLSDLDLALDLDVDLDAHPLLPAQAYQPAQHVTSTAWAVAADGGDRSAQLAAAAEDLRDVKQAVDFFASMGEFDQAVATLRSHLDRHAGVSPGGWMELLHLLAMLGRRDEFEHARGDFARRFNAGVPPYERWTHAGPGLDEYEATIARIADAWPTRRALDVIEQVVVNDPGVVHEATYSLDAFEELVMLHQVCHDLVARDGSAAPAAAATAAGEPKASAFGLDLDLDLSSHGPLNH